MTGTVQWLQQLMCGLRGHEEVFCFERNRLSLRCLGCGYETPGWVIETAGRHPEPIARERVPRGGGGLGRLHRTLDAHARA